MTGNASPHSLASAPAGLGVGEPVVRPISGPIAKGFQIVLDHINPVLTPFRDLVPILVLGRKAFVTRYDDVKEIFLADDVFGVPYAEKLDVITGGMPFLLGMEDSALYRHNRDALRSVIRPEDVERSLVPATEASAERLLTTVDGCVEVTDYFRRVTFEVLLDYFGTPAPTHGDIAVWSTRLFEYIFHIDKDAALEKEARAYAAALLAHLDEVIRARKVGGGDKDDVLGRCLKKQALGESGFHRPGNPCGTGRTDRCGIAATGYGFAESRRAAFAPLENPCGNASSRAQRRRSEVLQIRFRSACDLIRSRLFSDAPPKRTMCLRLARGRAKTIRRGTDVFFFFASAMMDARQIPDPKSFNPDRAPNNYVLFGHGLHQCFGIHINKRLLPLMLKPLLKRSGLRRASGAEGRLRKQTVFPDRLVVCFDEAAGEHRSGVLRTLVVHLLS